MHNLTTEGMEFALRMYAAQPAFGGNDPTRAMLAGAVSHEFTRGIQLAAKLAHEQMQATIRLRYAS